MHSVKVLCSTELNIRSVSSRPVPGSNKEASLIVPGLPLGERGCFSLSHCAEHIFKKH